MHTPAKRILFVCLGNICRSPAAECIFRVLATQAKLQEAALCDSCGTEAYHQGKPSDPRMRQAAAKRSYDLTHHARHLRKEDFTNFDLILPMDNDNEEVLRDRCPSPDLLSRIRPFVSFCTTSRPTEIPDPYYDRDSGFNTVLDLLEEGCANLVKEIQGNSL
jgi:protein-tyrosine phosphatase